MDKTICGLVGAASALALGGGAKAAAIAEAPVQPGPAQSYAELLDPIPGAAEILRAQQESPVRLAQAVIPIPVPVPAYGDRYYHHHHHHHHRYQQQGWYRWRWHPHHHHHHHHHHYYEGY